jgi:HAD superfamily hydrolase (TIGR01549 family)
MVANAFLFDVDGTLLDTIPLYAKALSSDSTVRNSIEQRLREGDNIVRIVRDMKCSRSTFVQRCLGALEKSIAYPGVEVALEQLDERDIPMGIVTNLPPDILQPVLDGFGWRRFFSAEEYRAGKPSPKGVRSAMASMGISPRADVVFVGDRLVDWRAAQAARVTFAWASYGYGEECPTDECPVIDSFDDVLSL